MATDELLPLYDTIAQCNRCGFCQAGCPVFRTTGSEHSLGRGRQAVARALILGHMELTPEVAHALEDCLLCRGCTAHCFPGHQDRRDRPGHPPRLSQAPRPAPLAALPVPGDHGPQQAAGNRRAHGPVGQAARPDQAGREVRHPAPGGPALPDGGRAAAAHGRQALPARRPGAGARAPGSQAPHRLLRLLRHELRVPRGGGRHAARPGPQRLRRHHHGQHLLRPAGALLRRPRHGPGDRPQERRPHGRRGPRAGGRGLGLRQLQHPSQGIRRPAQG